MSGKARASRISPHSPHFNSPHNLRFRLTVKMSTAIHDLIKDLHKFQNLDSGIEGDFPLDAAVIESQSSLAFH
jgi:hypothetical protein